ncbi:MAG TPA: FUSC family protein [Novosphingobium sp.]
MARPSRAKIGNRAQVHLAVQIVTACFISYAGGIALGLEQTQWAVLTSIIVLQASVGASIKAMIDRFVGSLGGAIVGVAISVGLHHFGFTSPGLALVLGLPPLILLAAVKPAYRVTPITFIILILTPNLQEMGPVASAYERMLEIVAGSVVALAVSLAVLPARAHDALARSVSDALSAMAGLMTVLPGGMRGEPDPVAIDAAHRKIRLAIGKAEAAAEEALRERATHLTNAVDPLPVCRTLRRLRHDIAILGRTMLAPLPDSVQPAVLSPVEDVCGTISAFFTASAAAFAARRLSPDLAAVDASFVAQAAAVKAIRERGLARSLADDDLARLFGLGFALEQMHRDLQDLMERCEELARISEHGGGSAPAEPPNPLSSP